MYKYKKDGTVSDLLKGIMSVPTDFPEPAIKDDKPEKEKDTVTENESVDNEASGNGTVGYKPAVPEDNISERKKEAEKDYLQWKQSKKPEYTDKYKSSIEKLLYDLENREFDYDVTKDRVYQRYRDSVKTSAELALADAVGLASALNGGYSTSYAQLAGQSAFYNTMKAADDIIPQLYSDAFERFSYETDNMEDRLDHLLDMEEAQWERYLDMLDEYNSEGDRLFDRFTELSDEEFDRFYSIYKLA